ncbi:MAG: hypothetical protein ACLFTK_09790 [Anaerolineales bacterium]
MTWRHLPAPPLAQRLMRWGLGAAVFISLGGTLALALGIANPPRAPNLHAAADLPPLTLAPGAAMAEPLGTLPARAFTLDMQAEWRGHPFTAWGVWLDESPARRVFIGLNGAGYSGAWACPPNTVPPGDCAALHARDGRHTGWRAFPHIRAAGANTLRLHQAGDFLEIRINHELLWHIPYAPPALAWGLWARASNDSDAQQVAGRWWLRDISP